VQIFFEPKYKTNCLGAPASNFLLEQLSALAFLTARSESGKFHADLQFQPRVSLKIQIFASARTQ
jgi:hypothetical protein